MFDFKKLFQINIKKNKDGKFYPLTSFLIKKLLIGNFFIFSFVTAIQMIFDIGQARFSKKAIIKEKVSPCKFMLPWQYVIIKL